MHYDLHVLDKLINNVFYTVLVLKLLYNDKLFILFRYNNII